MKKEYTVGKEVFCHWDAKDLHDLEYQRKILLFTMHKRLPDRLRKAVTLLFPVTTPIFL